MDIEARARDDHHDSLRLWLRMLTCTQLIEGRVRRFLRSDFATTLPRFDLLAQLERQPKAKGNRGQRMSDLSKRLMVTGGNVTGITDQLVSEGLVARTTDPVDRRAFLIELTPAGRKVFAEMARKHEELIRELFGGLKVAEREALLALLGQLKHSLNGAPAGAAEARKRAAKASSSTAVSTKPVRKTRERKHGIR
jgi:DNA-binding MarR family transcriptional regulator